MELMPFEPYLTILVARLDMGERWSARRSFSGILHIATTPQAALQAALDERRYREEHGIGMDRFIELKHEVQP